MYNIIYADRDGHIEYLFIAPVPKRSGRRLEFLESASSVPGDTSRLLPSGTLSTRNLAGK